MRNPETSVAVLPVESEDASRDAVSAQLVTVAAIAEDDTLQVRIGNRGPLVPARLAVQVTRERVEVAVTLQQQAVAVFENGDRSRPVIIGFIEPLAARQTSTPSTSPMVEADVDGRRVRVTAQDEVVLQCGNASITLRRNGRVIIRGTYVETHAEGTNRIKGGQVQIN